MTGAILGEPCKDLTDQFESMRRKRNEMTYEAGTLLSKSESEKAFSDAIAVLRRTLEDAKSENPQLELKFKIRDRDG